MSHFNAGIVTRHRTTDGATNGVLVDVLFIAYPPVPAVDMFARVLRVIHFFPGIGMNACGSHFTVPQLTP